MDVGEDLADQILGPLDKVPYGDRNGPGKTLANVRRRLVQRAQNPLFALRIIVAGIGAQLNSPGMIVNSGDCRISWLRVSSAFK